MPGARPKSRATRAALFLSVAAVAGAGGNLAACSDDAGDSSDAQVSSDAAYGGPALDAPFVSDAAVYGAPAFDAAADVATDAAYGAPDGTFLRDAADGSDGADGGSD